MSPPSPPAPSDATRPETFPMTSTGTNNTEDPKRTCSTTARANKEIATSVMPPIQPLIVSTTCDPAIRKPPFGWCDLTFHTFLQ